MMLRCKTGTILVVLVSLLVCQGCVKNRVEDEKEILGHDPSFQKDLDMRNSLIEQLASLKSAYINMKQGIEAQISALKEKKALAKKDYLASIEKIKRQINPEKRQLQLEMMEMQRKYKLKNVELKDINKDISEIDALINKKDKLDLTQEEIQTWKDRLASLIERKAEVSSGIERLKKEIEITKLKTRVLVVQ